MSATRWWFSGGLALHAAGAVAARLAAHQCHEAGCDLQAGWWTAVMYAATLAAAGNAWLLWHGDDDGDDGAEE